MPHHAQKRAYGALMDPEDDEPPRWLTTVQAAKWLGVGQKSVLKLVNDGRIRGYRVGDRTIRLRKSDIDAYLEQSIVEPGSLGIDSSDENED
jgi:excisionase family DNA binding protein